jgi:hypothetical protein
VSSERLVAVKGQRVMPSDDPPVKRAREMDRDASTGRRLLDVIYRIVYGLFVNLYKLSIYKYIPEAT